MTQSAQPRPTPPAPIPDDHVVVGVIVGIWGLRGDVKVEAYSDYAGRFAPGNVVYVDGERTIILRARPHKAGYVVGLESVTNRTAAQAMRGQTLTIQSAALPVLDEGTFFYFDIINIAVRTTTGDDLGRVAEILTTGASDVYVIRGVAREVLIPAVAEYVLDVDTEQRVMTVSLPDGYLDEM